MKKKNKNDIDEYSGKIRVCLTSYDYSILDLSVKKILEIIKKTNANIIGPIPFPTYKHKITILRATHKYKDSREQFEISVHKRLIDIVNPNKITINTLKSLSLPSGVEINVKQIKLL